jgi:hypothetical protein
MVGIPLRAAKFRKSRYCGKIGARPEWKKEDARDAAAVPNVEEKCTNHSNHLKRIFYVLRLRYRSKYEWFRRRIYN